MKSFTILAFSALVAMVSAIPQEPTASVTVSLSPQASCAAKCPVTDICCQAQCAGVPCPNESMANKTTECAMNCKQGNGSPADTEAYAQCQSSCISAYFFSDTATLPAATRTSPSSATATGSDAASGSGSQTASATNSGGAAPKSSSGATNVQYQLGSTAASIIGLIMAAFAL